VTPFASRAWMVVGLMDLPSSTLTVRRLEQLHRVSNISRSGYVPSILTVTNPSQLESPPISWRDIQWLQSIRCRAQLANPWISPRSGRPPAYSTASWGQPPKGVRSDMRRHAEISNSTRLLTDANEATVLTLVQLFIKRRWRAWQNARGANPSASSPLQRFNVRV